MVPPMQVRRISPASTPLFGNHCRLRKPPAGAAAVMLWHIGPVRLPLQDKASGPIHWLWEPETNQRVLAPRRLPHPQLVGPHTAAGHPATVAVFQREFQPVCLLPAMQWGTLHSSTPYLLRACLLDAFSPALGGHFRVWPCVGSSHKKGGVASEILTPFLVVSQ